MPKKPLSAYTNFFKQIATDALKAKPDLKVTEIGKMAGLQWNALSDEDKKPFIKLAEDSKKVYESRMEEWNKKGCFKFEDGTLSTDPRNLDRV